MLCVSHNSKVEIFSDFSMTPLVPEALALDTIPVPDSDRTTETVVVVGAVVVRGARMLSVPIPDTRTPVPETLDSGAVEGVVASVPEDGPTPAALVLVSVGIRLAVGERAVAEVVVVAGTTSSRAALTPGWALLSPSLPGMWRTLCVCFFAHLVDTFYFFSV